MKQFETGALIREFQHTLRNILAAYPEIETVNHLEGISRQIVKSILTPNPLSIYIPSEYGGLGGQPVHCLSLLEAAAYESIAVGLMLGINGSLFLEPVGKYGHSTTKEKVLPSFLKDNSLGGLMITEPDYGTDALSMQTAYSTSGSGYVLEGTKHWAGLTGLADYWLITARKEKEKGGLARDIDMFVVENSQPGQRIEVEQYYHKLGLFLIPYGLNTINVSVPTTAKLIPRTTGIKMMMDLLHRSRLRLSGIGMGFIKRMLDESLIHCQQRSVGNKKLSSYDQVQHRLSQLQAWYTVNSAMCHYASKVSGVENDLASFGLQANSTKAVLTDMMQDAAQSFLQLTGAKGFRRDHLAGRAVVDSRPFQIFEGSNDVMYIQIGEAILKAMKKKKETNFYTFLSTFDLTEKIAGHYRYLLEFNLDAAVLQRTKMVLGKIIARLITTEFALDLLETGFRKDLVDNALRVVGNTLAELVPSVTQLRQVNVIEEYRGESDWKVSGTLKGKT